MTDADEIAAFKAAIEPMFGPIFAAAKAGNLEGAVRHLIDGSASEVGYFERQAEASRRIELDNAGMLPLLLSQTPPPKITASDLAAIAVPITIACGTATAPAYRLVAEAAARLLPSRRHYRIEGAGHFWPDEDPQGFVSLVRQWLSEREKLG
jgi:pimeloyl-ACP methyl ester carboxylesterase